MSKEYYVVIKPFIGIGKFVSIDFKVYVYNYVPKKADNQVGLSITPAKRHFKFLAVESKIGDWEVMAQDGSISAVKMGELVAEHYSRAFGDLWDMSSRQGLPWLSTYLRNSWEAFMLDVRMECRGIEGSDAETQIISQKVMAYSVFLQNCAHYVCDDGSGFPL